MDLEGETVTLSCKYSGSVWFLFLYQQKSSLSPQFIIADFSDNTEKFSVKHVKHEKEFHVEISSAAVSDSAVYYCALQPTVTGNYNTTQHPQEVVTHRTNTYYQRQRFSGRTKLFDCDLISHSLCCSGRTEFICCLCVFKNSKDMLLYLFLLLSHILGEFKNRDSSLLEAAPGSNRLRTLLLDKKKQNKLLSFLFKQWS
uniref:Ig-like domain-containing protein n=1 Tax=Oryzias melastigma TaxID=30732 RepID=A0A3B3C242_ORYME